MGRFDKSLIVTRKNFPFVSHCFGEILADFPKERERGLWAREKYEGRGRKLEPRRTRSSPPFILARGLAPKFPSLFFRTPATQARDNQAIL